MIDTLQATVRFPDGIATRHLYLKHEDRDGTDVWTGWNSDRVRQQHAGILETHERHEAWVKEIAEHIEKLNASMAELKGKRGVSVTAKRAQLKEALKTAKAALAVANGDLARVKVHVDAIEHDDAFPEIVAFV